jgi:hypothetical protein
MHRSVLEPGKLTSCRVNALSRLSEPQTATKKLMMAAGKIHGDSDSCKELMNV